MASYNKVILMGNLTRDPELRYTSSGTPICSFGLAVNQKYKVNDEWRDDTCFVDISVWSRQGENCNQYLSKGKAALVEGRLKFSSWTSPDGQKRSKLEVVASSVTFLSSPQEGSYDGVRQGGGGYNNNAPQQGGGGYNSNAPQQGGGGYNNNAPQQGGGGYNSNAPQQGDAGHNNNAPNAPQQEGDAGHNNNAPQQGGGSYSNNAQPNREAEQHAGTDEPPFPSDDEIPF